MAEETPETLALSQALDRCVERGVSLPLSVAVQLVIEAMRDLEIDLEGGMRGGVWSREVHGDIWPASIALSVGGSVSLLPPRPGEPTAWQGERLRYAPPETRRGAPVSARGDVFGFAGVLYRLLQVDGLPAAESEIGVILGAALALDPERRTPTPDVFLEELIGYQARSGEPDAPRLARRWVRAIVAGAVKPAAPSVTEPASAPHARAGEGPSEGSRLRAGNTLPGVRDAFASIDGSAFDVTAPPIVHKEDRSDEFEQPFDGEEGVLSFTGDLDLDGASGGPDALSFIEDDVLSFTGDVDPGSEDDEASLPSWSGSERHDSLELRDGVIEGDDQPAEPAATVSMVSGGAHLFADGRALGPLPLLDMERALAQTRDATALVAFSGRRWRPVGASGALGGGVRPRRRTIALMDLGPALAELAAGAGAVRVALYHEFEAAVFELGGGRVLTAAVPGQGAMVERLVLDEGLVDADDLPRVAEDAPERDETLLRQLTLQRKLTLGQAGRIRRRIVRRLLATPFAWSAAEALVQRGPRRAIPVAGTGLQLAEGIAYVVRHATPASRLESLWNECRDHTVVRNEQAWAAVDDLPLLPDEQRFAAALPPRAPVLDVLGSWWDEGREAASTLLFLCVQMGLAEVVEPGDRTSAGS